MTEVYVLDYGGGNVRSLLNALQLLGCQVRFITCPADFDKAQRLIFPGVGAFGACLQQLARQGYVRPTFLNLSFSLPLSFSILSASVATAPLRVLTFLCSQSSCG